MCVLGQWPDSTPVLSLYFCASVLCSCIPLKVLMLKTGLMAVCTQMGKGVVSEDNAGYIGCTALSDNDLVHVAIKNADLIINVGHDISEKPPFIMNHNKPPLVIHLNFTRPSVDPVYFPHLVLVGDIAEVLLCPCTAVAAPPPPVPWPVSSATPVPCVSVSPSLFLTVRWNCVCVCVCVCVCPGQLCPCTLAPVPVLCA